MSRADAPDPARILVVDGDGVSRLTARRSLEEAGFEVWEAGDGAAALARCEGRPPDLVLLDLAVPVTEGLATCARLRALPGCRDVPVLVITAAEAVTAIDRAYRAGATDFATRPLDWSVLCQRIRYLLRGSAAMEALQRSEADHRALLEANPDIMMRLSARGEVLDLRPEGGWLELRVGTHLEAVLPDPARSAFRDAIAAALADAPVQAFDCRLGHRGRVTDYEVRVVASVRGEVIALIRDITESRRAEERIRFLAYHDELTGLPNRALFRQRLEQSLATARRHARVLAVLAVDVNQTRRIDESLGQPGGDLLLRGVVGRMQRCLRSSDAILPSGPAADHIGMLARLGGDEFSVLLPEIGDFRDAARVAERLLGTLEEPFQVEGYEIHASACIGVAIHPADGMDADALLKHAAIALYHARQGGTRGYRLYSAAMNTAVRHRLSMETQLRRALEREELELHYQPQVDMSSGRMVGVEALLRWSNPHLGSVSPADFIPVAEDSGLIVPIGEWVLRSACRQARAWREEGLEPLRMAVNLSAHQFVQAGLSDLVAAVLREAGIAPCLLELEMTESLLMGDVEAAVATLGTLKSMGVGIAVDDFGTGYSSLSYLKRFPIDRLKIDRSFVRDITVCPDDAAIAQAVIAMARSLKLAVIAEGVESRAQLAFLRARHCDEFQGYYCSPPVQAREIAALLRRPASPDPAEDGAPARTLLLVDDEVRLIESLERSLRRDGYRVLTATSAREGLDRLACQPVGVVMADHLMPDMTGTEFLARVRELHPRTVRIVLSGNSDMVSLVAAVNEGAIYKFLAKPVSETILRGTLREAFAHHEAGREPTLECAEGSSPSP